MRKRSLPPGALLLVSAGLLAAAAVLVWAAVSPAPAERTEAEKRLKVDYSSIQPTSQEIPAGAAPTGEPSPGGGLLSEKSPPSVLSPGPSPAPERFLVRATEDGAAIFREGEASPLRSVALDLSALPPADRELLEAGIPAASLAQARQILEDYR